VIQLSRGEGWDPINRFNPATLLYLSQANIWISNITCRGFLCVQWIKTRGDCLLHIRTLVFSLYRFLYDISWPLIHVVLFQTHQCFDSKFTVLLRRFFLSTIWKGRKYVLSVIYQRLSCISAFDEILIHDPGQQWLLCDKIYKKLTRLKDNYQENGH
jgi:hypothetical protein